MRDSNLVAATLAAFAIASSFAFAGCTDDESAGVDWSGDGPVYVVSSRIFTPDGDNIDSYFHLVSSLDEGTAIDEGQALQIPGSARLFSIPEIGWLAIGDGESPTIQRYALDSSGLVPVGEAISLQPSGVESLWDTMYYVSPNKIYYPDRAGEQLVIIDPEAMAVTGKIPLPTTAREGYLALYGYASVVRGDKLLFSVGWFDWTNDVVLDETGLVVIDTATDTVERVDVDTRCGGITTPVNLASGDAYFLTSSLGASAHRLERLETPPCALRVLANEDSFDESYALELGDLVDGALAGEPVPAGGNAIFFRVFDEEAAVIEDGAFSWDLTGQSVWSWVRWDVSEDEAVAVDALDPSTADVVWFRTDDRTFGTEALDAEYSETRLLELTADGGPSPRLVAPGFLQGLARIR